MYKSSEHLPNYGDLSSNLKSYSEVCENIRQTMSNVIKLRSKGEDKKIETTELRMQGSFNFLTLKQLNRLAQIQCKSVKDQTLEAKQKLDGYNLQLENLQYEISHLQKEITKCLEFRSRHDDISLVSVEEFYNNAPTEISAPEFTRSDLHKQTLARLDFELQQRKELAHKLNGLEEIRKTVLGGIGEKKQNLQILGPALQNLLKASLPLQDALDIPLDHQAQQHKFAQLLPRPLYVLYVQTKGYQEACDSQLNVLIDGNAELATKFQETIHKSSYVNGGNQLGDESESDQDEADDQDSGRGHKRKRIKDVSMEEENHDNFNSVFSSHPLMVVLKLKMAIDSPSLKLTFTYFTSLNVVFVKSQLETQNVSLDSSQSDKSSLLDDANILCCLLANDDYGLKSPNPSTNFLLQQSSLDLSSLFANYGRPFYWVQSICGLVFPPGQTSVKGEDMQLSFGRIQDTVHCLRQRVAARINLQEQIRQFSKSIIPYNPGTILDLPSKIHCTLTSWTRISYSDYKNLPHVASVIELGILGASESSCHHYYLAIIKRGSSVIVQAAFVIFNDYPKTVPLVTISLQWKGLKTSSNDQNIQEMEAELNVRWPKKNLKEIISLQLNKLMAMIDLYVEIECDNEEATQPVEFTLSKVCPQKARGPARLKPFLYKVPTKSFIHRSYED